MPSCVPPKVSFKLMTKQIPFDAMEQQMYIHILCEHKHLESDLQMHFLSCPARVRTSAA
jgi:hypothetical protein